MITMLPEREDPVPAVEIIKKIISLMATCLGLAIILIGFKYAMDIFELIFTILKSPTYLTGPIQQMAESIGGRAFDLKLESRSVPLANIMALMVYCGGAVAECLAHPGTDAHRRKNRSADRRRPKRREAASPKRIRQQHAAKNSVRKRQDSTPQLRGPKNILKSGEEDAENRPVFRFTLTLRTLRARSSPWPCRFQSRRELGAGWRPQCVRNAHRRSCGEYPHQPVPPPR